MNDRLYQIVTRVRDRLADAPPIDVLERHAREATNGKRPHRFVDALRATGAGRAIVAEIKAASPSAGDILPNLDVKSLAEEYDCGGACAISVVAEPDFFKGSMKWIGEAERWSGLPVLMKHFVVDPRQILQGIAEGADAVLLLASLLSTDELRSMIGIIRSFGRDALVEVHDEHELASALAAGATLIGVNNRDLKTFEVDLATAERLAQAIPKGVVRIAESGIRSRADATRMKEAGFDALLVGEHLLRKTDKVAAIRDLIGPPAIKICGIATVGDALNAADSGADFLGLVFAEGSPRRVAAKDAALIADAVRNSAPGVRLVGVFRDQHLEEIQAIANRIDLDLIQLHGSEPPSFIQLLQRPVIRAIRLPADFNRIADAAGSSWTLFDGNRPGSGESFDWEMELLVRPSRLFLAGGLTPDNVREAIARVRPDGVDVSSGVEERPGKKSLAKMRRFVEEVNQA